MKKYKVRVTERVFDEATGPQNVTTVELWAESASELLPPKCFRLIEDWNRDWENHVGHHGKEDLSFTVFEAPNEKGAYSI